MTEDILLVDKKDYIYTLTLNRPQKHNALTPQLLQQFRETLISLNEDEGIRVVIIRGAGDKAFSARFGMPQAKLGMMESYQAIQRFLNIVGLAYTKEIFFTGRMIEAPQAKEIGLVNQVVPQKDLEGFCYSMAREIASNAPLSVKGSKAIIEKCLGYQSLTHKVEKEIQGIVADIFRSEDCKEGMVGFMEKRKTRFPWKQ